MPLPFTAKEEQLYSTLPYIFIAEEGVLEGWCSGAGITLTVCVWQVCKGEEEENSDENNEPSPKN